jgi:hypothetical protein
VSEVGAKDRYELVSALQELDAINFAGVLLEQIETAPPSLQSSKLRDKVKSLREKFTKGLVHTPWAVKVGFISKPTCFLSLSEERTAGIHKYTGMSNRYLIRR